MAHPLAAGRQVEKGGNAEEPTPGSRVRVRHPDARFPGLRAYLADTSKASWESESRRMLGMPADWTSPLTRWSRLPTKAPARPCRGIGMEGSGFNAPPSSQTSRACVRAPLCRSRPCVVFRTVNEKAWWAGAEGKSAKEISSRDAIYALRSGTSAAPPPGSPPDRAGRRACRPARVRAGRRAPCP